MSGMGIKRLLLLSPVFLGSVFCNANPNFSAGSVNGVVLCADHHVYAWGSDSSALEMGSFMGLDTLAQGFESKKYYTTPQLVDTKGVKFTQVEVGTGCTFWGVSEKGVLYSWGQVVSEDGNDKYDSPVPVRSIAGLDGYGEDGTLGGKYIGNVKCVQGGTSGAIVLFNDGRALVSYTFFSDGKGKLVEDENGVVDDIVKVSAGDYSFRVLRSDGRLYSMGNWNGNNTQSTAALDDYSIKPLLLGETKKPLENIIDMASGDACAFALTKEGHLYGWGNSGWGGCTGIGSMSSSKTINAYRVLSGAYKTISGDEYMTSVKKVVAGRGYGMAMTFDGHLLYWGNNEGNGGVIGNGSTATYVLLPEFLIYKDGKVVDDAVDIIAGDNFAFVINKKGEYFAFGLNDKGQCGVGSDEKEIHYLHPFTLSCAVPTPCPSVTLGMKDTVELCPTGSALTAIVTAVEGEKYSVKWGYDGLIRSTDKNTEFPVLEEGPYTVELSGRCGKVSDFVYVRFKEIGIENLGAVSYVKNPDDVSKKDNILFRFRSDATDICLYADKESAQPFDTIKHMGGDGSISVLGKNVSIDHQVASVWADGEVRTSLVKNVGKEFDRTIRKKGMMLTAETPSVLKSFDLKIKNYDPSASNFTVTPELYKAVINETFGYYAVGEKVWEGKSQSFYVDSDSTVITVECGANIDGNGVYVLGMKSTGILSLYEHACDGATDTHNPVFESPILDEKGLGIRWIGETMNSYDASSDASSENCYFNLVFTQRSCLDCERVQLNSLLKALSDTSAIAAMAPNISAGSANGVLLCNDHQVYAWGTDSSAYGVENFLGLDTTVAGYERKDFYATPQLVNTNGVKLTQVDAGSGFTFWGVSDKGVLYSWGQTLCGGHQYYDKPTPVRSIPELVGYNEDGFPGGHYIGNVKSVKGSTTGVIVLFNDGRALMSYEHPACGDVRLITDENGVVDDIVKVSAGDNSFRVLRSDGRLYSAGEWNGNDAGADGRLADFVLKPLLLEETQRPLDNVIDMASGDACAFALTKDGDLYGWGNGGWGNCNGTGGLVTHIRAKRVMAGDYKSISGNDFMTSVKKVVAGRGYGMAMTFDGHLLYWGNNDGIGGVIGNGSEERSTPAPEFLIYKDGKVVDDAVDIIAGDNFAFVINKKSEYFVFGLNDNGQCGVGSDEKEIHYLHPFTLPCDMSDPCPSVSLGIMDSVEVCPTGSVLTANVTATDNETYSLQWNYNGQLSNSKDVNFPVYGEGHYMVEMNSRCGVSRDYVYVRIKNFGIVDLGDTSFVENPANLAEENLSFRFKSDAADIYLYADKNGAQPIDTIKHEGGDGLVYVLGKYASLDNQVASVWADKEQRTFLMKNVDPKESASFMDYGLLFSTDNSVVLNSFDLKVSVYSSLSENVTVTPVLYGLSYNAHYGSYDADSLVWKGEKQTFVDVDGDRNNRTVLTVKCGAALAAGKNYLLGMELNGHVSLFTYEFGTLKSNSVILESPVPDEYGLGVRCIGSSANKYSSMLNGSNSNCYFNLDFTQMSCADCEKVELKSVVKETEHVGVGDVEAYDASEIVDVYTPTGLLVKKSVMRADALKGLPKVVYIVGNTKAVKIDD